MPTIKNPNAPATDPQIGFIKSLAAEKGYDLTGLDTDTLTKGQASGLISIIKDYTAPTGPKPSLTDLAAGFSPQIEDEAQIPFIADADKPVVSLTLAQVKVALSWYGVVQGETDPTDNDDALEAILQLAAAAQAPKPAAPAPVAPKPAKAKTARQGQDR